MICLKISHSNIKNKIKDYLIYLFTLTALAVLMLSAFMITLFPFINKNGDGEFASNSLPAIVSLVLFSLMIYMNWFMLKKQSQELAIYMLSGIQKKHICFIYIYEHLLFGSIALVFGTLIGSIAFIFLENVYDVNVSVQEFFLAIMQSVLFFSLAFILSVLITVLAIPKMTIKGLMYLENYNEKLNISRTQIWKYFIITIVSLGIIVLQILFFNPFAASTIVLSIGLFLFFGYNALLCYIQYCREHRKKFFTKNKSVYLVGNFMSRIKTMIYMSTVISACVVMIMVSFIAGWIFTHSQGMLFGDEGSDFIMGFMQFYIAILFTLILFSIVALQQITDTKEHHNKLNVLRQLGANNSDINKLLLQQVIVNFTIPVLLAFVLLAVFIFPIHIQLKEVITNTTLLAGASIFTCIFISLYGIYIVVTYISLKNLGSNKIWN